MVPHGKVEEALHQAAQSETQVFAVTGIPDDRKGEQLAVLHTIDEARISEILGQLSSNGLPNLFMPPRGNFVKVDALPVLRDRQDGPASAQANCNERLSLKPELRDPQPRADRWLEIADRLSRASRGAA
jgi:acyl-[acyl-carrier-protein]-phospholipid O-acyltransferase/long-chain-fatty-acid--[acyl-carrier-protein] ligase